MSFWDHSLGELLRKGGPVMWPLLACSVVAIALVLDRAIALARARLSFDSFVERLRGLVNDGERASALRLCNRSASPIARTVEAYLASLELPEPQRKTIVEREGSLALEKVESRLRGLSSIAQVSTLLGLLGTVAGLVAAFHQIELNAGQVQPEDLAAGIWEALMTTVFGLTVAIPSFLAFHLFESRVDAIARRMSVMVAYLDEWVGWRSQEPAQAAVAGAEE